jgi:hypothetical protein
MIHPPPVPHRCRRANRCPERERLADGTVLGGQIPATDGLCPSCTRHTEQAITELPVDYTELDMLLGKTSAIGGPLVGGTRELPVPIRLSIEAVQAAIVHEVWCWAESVAEVMRIGWDSYDTGHSRPGFRVQRATRLLGSATSVLLSLRNVVHIGWDTDRPAAVERDGITGALLLLDLHHQTRQVAGRTRLVHRLPAPCPRCWFSALERPNGDDIITCTNCARRYTWDEYDKLCNALASSRDAA